MIADRADGRLLGEVGFADFKRELDPPLDAPEAGWALAPAAHGRGYGSEALAAALDWADARFPRTACIIGPGNRPSLRLAAAMGYVQTARADYKGAPTLMFSRAAGSRGSPAAPSDPAS